MDTHQLLTEKSSDEQLRLDPVSEIIDVHAHTSNNKLWDLHTETARIEDLEKYAKQFNVGKIYLMATYFPFKGTGQFNKKLLEKIKGKSLFSIFGSLDAANNFSQGMAELEELADAGLISGIKLYPGYQEFWPSDYNVFPIYRLAQHYNLPVTFHGGELHHCCSRKDRKLKKFACGFSSCKIEELSSFSQPRAMLRAIEKFPEVKFIIAHLANPNFEQLRQIMAYHFNVYTDISGQFVSGTTHDYNEDSPEYRDLLKREMSMFLELENGLERFMFGTDFPIQSYQDSVDLVESLNLTPDEKKKIYHDNAFGLLEL